MSCRLADSCVFSGRDRGGAYSALCARAAGMRVRLPTASRSRSRRSRARPVAPPVVMKATSGIALRLRRDGHCLVAKRDGLDSKTRPAPGWRHAHLAGPVMRHLPECSTAPERGGGRRPRLRSIRRTAFASSTRYERVIARRVTVAENGFSCRRMRPWRSRRPNFLSLGGSG